MFIDVVDSSRRIWDYFVNNDVMSVSHPTENAGMTLVGTINGKTLATPGYNGFFVITRAAKTEAQVKVCLHFLDKMNDDPMITLCSYGIKGYSYDVDEEGYIVDLKTDATMGKAYGALDQALAFIPHMLLQVQPSQRQTERKIKELSVIADNAHYAVMNPAQVYLANSPSYALEGAMLEQILSDTRTQYICGRIDEAGLQAAFDKWEKVGEAVVREVNEQYQADH